MNRDESITLVNELCSEYRAVKVLQKKMDENGTLLRELTDTKPYKTVGRQLESAHKSQHFRNVIMAMIT